MAHLKKDKKELGTSFGVFLILFLRKVRDFDVIPKVCRQHPKVRDFYVIPKSAEGILAKKKNDLLA